MLLLLPRCLKPKSKLLGGVSLSLLIRSTPLLAACSSLSLFLLHIDDLSRDGLDRRIMHRIVTSMSISIFDIFIFTQLDL